MDFIQRANDSETHQVKIIFNNTVNDYNTLFGGFAMKWMDEVAYITATRFCRKKVVTVKVDEIKFKKPIHFGNIAEIIGRVSKAGNIKLQINVKIFIEQKYRNIKNLAVEGSFTFTAIDDEHKPTKLID